ITGIGIWCEALRSTYLPSRASPFVSSASRTTLRTILSPSLLRGNLTTTQLSSLELPGEERTMVGEELLPPYTPVERSRELRHTSKTLRQRVVQTRNRSRQMQTRVQQLLRTSARILSVWHIVLGGRQPA